MCKTKNILSQNGQGRRKVGKKGKHSRDMKRSVGFALSPADPVTAEVPPLQKYTNPSPSAIVQQHQIQCHRGS